MTILEKYQVSWYKELTFKELVEVLENHKKYANFNKLGITCAIRESEKLSKKERVEVRDLFKSKFLKYYQTLDIVDLELMDLDTERFFENDRRGMKRKFRAFVGADKFDTLIEKISNDYDADINIRDFEDIERLLREGQERTLKNIKSGKMRHPSERVKTALTDPFVFGFKAREDIFQQINADLLAKKHSFHKINFYRYAETPIIKSKADKKKLGVYPKDVQRNRRIEKKRSRIVFDKIDIEPFLI